MKVWIKLLIGSALGIAIGFLLPDNESVFSALIWIERFALNIGRYAVVPVLIFSLTISVYQLRSDNQFWPMVLKNILVIIGISAFVIFCGIMATIIFLPKARIPIETVEQTEILALSIAENIIDLFPSNMLSILSNDGIYLFPFCVLAFFIGMGLNYDRAFSKPVISLVDSLSRIFLYIVTFFSEILGIILIALAAFWAVRYNELLQAKVYKELILMLGLFSVILCFIALPMFLYLIRPRTNPWKVLYGYIGAALTAFFSGDINFSIPILLRLSKDNLGIRRRSNALSISLFSTFCRCGSAMTAAAAFIVIIKSYSYLRIGTADLFTIGLYAFAISFVLARHPGDGAFIALAALCLTYGGGEYKAAYLIVKPMAFYLVAIGTFIDVMINAFGAYAIARTSGNVEEKGMSHFV